MNRVQAKVVLCKCAEGKRIFGMRIQEHERDWLATWAFPFKNESTAKREETDDLIMGNIFFSNDFPGCPYCRTGKFILCANCQRLNCNPGNNEIFVCNWCGNEGEVTSFDGDGIKAGGDR